MVTRNWYSPEGEKEKSSGNTTAHGGKKNAFEQLELHQPSKVISTSKLNALRRLHFWPINRVVYPDLAPYCYGL
jgi:hypothetical protein